MLLPFNPLLCHGTRPLVLQLSHQKDHTPVCIVTGPSPDSLLFFHQLLLSSVGKVERWLGSEESSLASEGLAVGAQEEREEWPGALIKLSESGAVPIRPKCPCPFG